MISLKQAALGGFLAVIATQIHANEPEPRKFLSEDVFGLEYASNPQISPDGRRIVYERRSNRIMSDRTVSALWIASASGSEHRPLLDGPQNYGSPRWSPDGERLAYVSRSDDGRAAIYVRWLDTGQTAEITTLDSSPSSLTWSPDGTWLAYTRRVEEKTKPLAKAPKKPKGAKWAPAVKVVDQVRYRWDGRGFLDPNYTHIFVVPSDGGTPRQLTKGKFDHSGSLSWTPDSAEIFFSANRNPDWEYETVESDIFSVSVNDGTLTQITNDPGSESSPKVSPDGNHIAFIKSDNLPQPFWPVNLNVMRRDGSAKRALTTDMDRRIFDPQWAGNRTVYFRYDDRGQRKVGHTDLNGRITTVVDDLGGTTLGRPYLSGSYTVTRNGTLAYTLGRPDRPADLAVHTRGRSRRLTNLNEDLLGHRDLGQVHEITYTSSFDGTEIQGWYVTPPGFDPNKKYPLVLEIHGGPHSAYGAHFSAEVQRYAAEGYVVFYDNHRGSSTYGQDFALLLKYKYSSREDFADHMSGVDAMIAKGFIDEENLFVTGGSAGGIATAYLVGLTDRFKAAVAAKPVINWVSKALTGDIYVYQIRHQFPALPWEDPEHYWERSPLSLVGNVTTPTMLLTGEQDYRTPISESEQFYQALKLRRVDTMMVRVPGSSHGIAGRPSRLIAKADSILAWFERYRTGPGASSEASPERTKDMD